MTTGWLPAEDRVRSPHTGWVRAHWEAVADHVLGAVATHTSAEGSQVTTSPRQDASTGLEGFARGALLAAYRLVGSDDDAVRAPLAAWLARGLDAGTRRGGPGAWPRPADRHQSIVEAAWIAIALAETHDLVWARLEEPVRRRVTQWLAEVGGKAVFDNNWLLYPVVVDGFLSTVAGPHDPAATATALRRVEAMYRGDGWYSDGPGSCFGHYSAWGMQLLLAHWLRITGSDAYPGGAAALRQRLTAFLEEYARLIGPDGTPVLHGRSLVYRYATAAPFWLGTLLDASPFPPAGTRRRTSAMVRHFVLCGAHDDGIPPLGWHGAFAPLADAYSTPLSALLCSQAFAGLLVPGDEPAWTDVEPDDPRSFDDARVLATPGFGCMTQGPVLRLVSHGATSEQVADHPGFRRVGYSTHSAPGAGALGELDVDGQVNVVAGGGALLRRRDFTLVGAEDHFAASTWEPRPDEPAPSRRLVHRVARRARAALRMGVAPAPSTGVRVECASVVRADMELRVIHAWAPVGGTIRDGGLGVSHDAPPRVARGLGWCSATTAGGLTGAVVGLHGWGSSGSCAGVDASPFGRHTVVPYVDGQFSPDSLLVTAHLLTFEPVDAEALQRRVRVTPVGRRAVVIALPDGEEHLVQLGDAEVSGITVGALAIDGPCRYARSSPDGTTALLAPG